MGTVDPFDIPSADDYLESVFGPEGYLASRFPGYRIRPGQISLTKAIDESIAFGDNLLAEGPTATGKSVSYLVPASFYASTKKKRVVVATAAINLQEQLFYKDLPMLAEILPWTFTYSLLKGKNNYVCTKKHLEGSKNMFSGFRGTEDDKAQLEEVRAWVDELLQKEGSTGDVSELEFQPSNNVWREFSVSADDCEGRDCKQYDKCFAIPAQAAAREADIIVTNYHLLFAHLAVKQKTDLDVVLPPFDILICDEIHKMSDIARNFFGFNISPEAIRRASNILGRTSTNGLHVAGCASNLFEGLVDYKNSDRYRTRIKEKLIDDHRLGRSWKALEAAITKCMVDYAAELEERHQELARASWMGENDPSTKKLKAFIRRIEKSSDRLLEIRSQLHEVFTLENSEENVYFIDTTEKGYTSIASKPINVGGILHSTLFEKTPCVIGTSATMSTDGDFRFIASEIGCNNYNSIIAESPFDWEKQMLLVLPEMPDPNDKDWFPDAVADRVEEVIELAGGRTLALFTSYKNLQTTFDKINGHRDFKILRQGDAPRTKLIERFKNDVSSVLLGTESFWAGVDVPGESLSVVVIDRIPFPTPDDPIMDAISESNPRGWFHEYAIPKAIISLKQGFGRLIRSSSDRGVVVILDNRMTKKRYGRQFLRSLPCVPVTDDINEVGTFLDCRSLAELPDGEYFDRVFHQ